MALIEAPSDGASSTTERRSSQISTNSDTTEVGTRTRSSTSEDPEKQAPEKGDLDSDTSQDLSKVDEGQQSEDEEHAAEERDVEKQEFQKRDGEKQATNQQDGASSSSLPPSIPQSQLPGPGPGSATAVASNQGPVEQATDYPEHNYEKLAQKHPRPTDHLSMTIGPPIILFLDLIVPCIIYYTWYNNATRNWRRQCNLPIDGVDHEDLTAATLCSIPKPEFDKDILGYAVISFGFGELYILIARVWRLFAHREDCAPLLSKSRWELDATSWVYAVAMIIALIPFVTGSTLEIPMLYLYGPAFLMAFLGILMVITLLPITLPVGINSHPRGTRVRPFIYYAAEDFIAVDGLQDRDFRVRYNDRYEQSAGFRRMFVVLTLWWMFGVVAYIGCLSAVIWTVEFHIAFGLSLGVLFSYIIIWACSSYVIVKFEMHRERIKFEDLGHF